MLLACVISAITFGAVGFMLRFMAALLREDPPTVRWVVVPTSRELQRVALKVRYQEYDRCATKFNRSKYYPELSENKGHDKEGCTVGLNAPDICATSTGRGWRSIHNGLYVLHRHRFQHDRSARNTSGVKSSSSRSGAFARRG